MKVVSKKMKIRDVAKRWRMQYPEGCAVDKENTYKALRARKPKTEDEVEQIIGNGSWIRNTCGECQKDVSVLVQLGQEPGYDSETAYVCLNCLQKAIKKGQQA